MIETVKRMLGQSDRELVAECRQCGSNVDSGAELCPVCGSSEIAQYDITGDELTHPSDLSLSVRFDRL